MRTDRLYMKNVITNFIETSQSERELNRRCQFIKEIINETKLSVIKDKGWDLIMKNCNKLPQTNSIFPKETVLPFAPLMRGSVDTRFAFPHLLTAPFLLWFICRRLSGGVPAKAGKVNKTQRSGEDGCYMFVCGSFKALGVTF